MHLVFMLMCVMLVAGTSAAQMCDGPSFNEQRIAFGTPLTDIAAGDIVLNSDGTPDLAVVNNSSDDVSILQSQRPKAVTCIADLTGEPDLNFLDVSTFLAAFAAGCP
jgi:hypothetical protein